MRGFDVRTVNLAIAGPRGGRRRYLLALEQRCVQFLALGQGTKRMWVDDAEDVVYVRAFDASVFRAVVFTFRLTGVGWTCQSMLQDMAWPAALPTALYKHLLDFLQ